VPGIAPHVPKSTRDGLLSLMLGAAEDPAALVREAAAMHLAHLLPALDDLSVYLQGKHWYCQEDDWSQGMVKGVSSKGRHHIKAHNKPSPFSRYRSGGWPAGAAGLGVVRAQVERVVFQLVLRLGRMVVDEALQTLVPAFVTWSIVRKHPFGKVLRAVMQRMRAEVDKCPPLVPPSAADAKRARGHMRSLGEREKWNFGVLLRMLTGLLGEVSGAPP